VDEAGLAFSDAHPRAKFVNLTILWHKRLLQLLRLSDAECLDFQEDLRLVINDRKGCQNVHHVVVVNHLIEVLGEDGLHVEQDVV